MPHACFRIALLLGLWMTTSAAATECRPAPGSFALDTLPGSTVETEGGWKVRSWGRVLSSWQSPDEETTRSRRGPRVRRLYTGGTSTVLYEVPLPTVSMGGALIGTGAWRSFNFSEPCSELEPELFEDVIVTVDDIGSIALADSGSDPAFDELVVFLTNGVEDPLTVRAGIAPDGGAGARTELESFYFAELPGGNGIDLQGVEIDALGFRYDHLEIHTPGSDPNNDGNWTDIVFDVTFLVFEPGGFFGDGFESGDTSAWSLVEP